MKKTNPNTHITVLTPSNTMATMPDEMISIGVRALDEMGFSVDFGENVKKEFLYMAGSVEDRVTDFNNAIHSSSSNIIMAVFGGYNSNQLLEKIDYEAIKNKKKIVVGYSDITAILNAIYAKTGVASIHGPGFASFCDPNCFPQMKTSFKNLISGNSPIIYTEPNQAACDLWFLKQNFGPRELYQHPKWTAIKEGSACGKLIGGNLETFLALASTEYMPSTKEAVLLIEATFNESPGQFDRNVTQLRHMGVFKNISGLIVGQFSAENKLSTVETMQQILCRATDGYNFPILINTSFSHVDPILPLPIGGAIQIKAFANENSITILEAFSRSLLT